MNALSTKPVALNFPAIRRLFGAAALLLSLARVHAQYDPDWKWNFRVGALVGFNIKANFKNANNLSLSGVNPGATNTPGVDHFFDDGSVRVDDFKNAGGYTTYWSYQNPQQNDTANGRLLYHAASSFTSTGGGGFSGNADAAYVGFELAGGGYLWRWDHMRLGFDLGFGYLPITISGKESQVNGTLNQNTYAFNVPNGVVLPGAPYNGGPSGFGQPSINDNMSLVSSGGTNAVLNGTQTLDVTLLTFRLGPSLYIELSRYFGISVSAGPALGIVTGDLRFNETFSTDPPGTHHTGQFGSTDFVYGGYVNASVMYHVTTGGDFFLSAQYMPLSDANFSGGGRSARLNLKGAFYVSAGINWPF